PAPCTHQLVGPRVPAPGPLRLDVRVGPLERTSEPAGETGWEETGAESPPKLGAGTGEEERGGQAAGDRRPEGGVVVGPHPCRDREVPQRLHPRLPIEPGEPLVFLLVSIANRGPLAVRSAHQLHGFDRRDPMLPVRYP